MPELRIALKEWPLVCSLLTAGRCALLLRKGGIEEDQGPGRFQLEHSRFALFPAREHEQAEWIKPGWQAPAPPGLPAGPARSATGASAVPDVVFVPGYAEVADIRPIPRNAQGLADRATFDRLDDLHPWLAPQIDMRFAYKPDRPLYVVVLRAFRLAQPRPLTITDAYAGCRSWVTLSDADALHEADLANASLAMDPGDLDEVVRRVRETLG